MGGIEGNEMRMTRYENGTTEYIINVEIDKKTTETVFTQGIETTKT